MPTPATHALQTIRIGDSVRIELPPIDAELSFRSAQLTTRLGAYFVIVLCAVIAVCPVFTTMDAWTRINRLLPLNNLIDILIAIGFAFRELFFWGIAFSMINGLALQFFAKCANVTFDGDQIALCRRRGPYSRTKKIFAWNIKSIYMLAPDVTSERQLRMPVDERRTVVWIQSTGIWAWQLGYEYPYAVARSIVNAFSTQMIEQKLPISLVPRNSAGAASSVDVVDTMAPAFLNADLNEAPDGCDARIETTGECQRITFARDRITLATLLKSVEFRSGFWAIGLGLLMYLGLGWLARAVAIPPQMAIVMLVYSAAVGVLFVSIPLYVRLASISFCITPRNLEKTYHCVIFRFTRRWPRERIAAIRPGHAVGDKGRCRNVVEMLQADGTRVELLPGGVLLLRYVATLLRRGLQVPAARPDGYAGDPTEREWHLQDAPEPPKDCRLRFVALEDRSVITQPPKGFGPSTWLSFLFFSIILIGAAIVLPALALPHAVKPDDRRAIIFLSCMFVALSTFGIFVTYWEAVDQYLFVVTPGSLTITRKGMRASHWTRDELAAIGTESTYPTNPKSGVKLIITRNDGQVTKPYNSSPDSTRYLATLLRKALGLPPEVPAVETEQADAGGTPSGTGSPEQPMKGGL